MRYRVGIADSGSSWSATAFELPGCHVSAPSHDELIGITPIVIADHLAWLRRGGIEAAADELVELDVDEELPAAQKEAADGEFCFVDDLASTTDEDVAIGIAILNWSRRDLLEAVRGVAPTILDWRPPITAMAQVDEWNPEPRTIREITHEIASAEAYYRTALHDGPDASEPDPDASDLATQRHRLVDVLRGLDRDDRSRLFKPQRPWQDRPEHWTARKVIRRAISHERFHTAEIHQRLSWLLVGVPRVRVG